MRKTLIWVAVVIAAALIQTTWLDAIKLRGVLPDLTLLLVVYFAGSGTEERAMMTGVLGGIYQDVAGDTLLGHHVFCLVVVAYVVGRIARRLITEHPGVKVGLVFCAAVINGILFTGIQYVQTPEIPATRLLLATVVPGAFYTALITPVVFLIMGRWLFAVRPPLEEEA